MSPGAIVLDAAVVAHALGGDSPWRAPAQQLLRRAERGDIDAYASVEMIQELVDHRMRRSGDREMSVAQGRWVMALCTILDFDRRVLDLSLELIERVPSIRGRDAVHAATALAHGVEVIASPDRAFDEIPGIRRLDPRDIG